MNAQRRGYLIEKMVEQYIREELLNLNMRATVPRVAILEVFHEEQRRRAEEANAAGERTQVVHFSTDEMFKLLIERKVDVGLATVYRVMP
ncbi:transcriptional repressor [Paenalcaligenes niemegkensis]|uniref:transcriptional repressor n=1 Tax=Paenalcaligenes niemegkensis TaxID=2895469 RepID=UPI001EE969F8|nr:transcriptional repressor [Paenalcaligenes niemegkensis]MCQ9616534.1 transcriptional repressor [Paenalcaligenes niemegkensis]